MRKKARRIAGSRASPLQLCWTGSGDRSRPWSNGRLRDRHRHRNRTRFVNPITLCNDATPARVQRIFLRPRLSIATFSILPGAFWARLGCRRGFMEWAAGQRRRAGIDAINGESDAGGAPSSSLAPNYSDRRRLTRGHGASSIVGTPDNWEAFGSI